MGTNHRAACWVMMDRAYEQYGKRDFADTRPGAASGIHPVGFTPPVSEEGRLLESPAAAVAELVTDPPEATQGSVSD